MIAGEGKNRNTGEDIFLNWLKKAMEGRYGGDDLGIALLFCSIVLAVLTTAVSVFQIGFLSLVPLAFAVYRILSKKIVKRRGENLVYLRVRYAVRHWFTSIPNRIRGRKQYKIYRCPGCRQKVRVPRRSGKASITCPVCSASFVKNTGRRSRNGK